MPGELELLAAAEAIAAFTLRLDIAWIPPCGKLGPALEVPGIHLLPMLDLVTRITLIHTTMVCVLGADVNREELIEFLDELLSCGPHDIKYKTRHFIFWA